jgi:glycosyltransferase involved in cell wall biosynthesis
MSLSPAVTVVIPTYNHAHFLKEALRSLCEQSYTDWEAIIVNNYSEDDTVSVVESFGDSRMVLENFRNNGVIAASRNRGIALARGRYVAFLDSDDTWYKDKLLHCIPYLDQGADLVSHALQCIGDREGPMYCGPEQRATFDAMLDKGSCITPSATVVRKEILDLVGNFSEDPACVTSEDYHLWLKLAREGVCMRFTTEILGEYRIHVGNQSGSVLRHLNSVLCVIDDFLPATSTTSFLMWRRRRQRYGLAYYSAGRGMQKNKQYADALKLFFHSVTLRPHFIKTYVAAAMTVFGYTLAKLTLQKGNADE